jgi:hypothetical protein
MQSTRYNNLEFGSVFKPGPWGGPRYNNLIQGPGQLPQWADRRYPGNTSSNESADTIMKKWDNQQMKRFQHFMDQFYKEKTPWRQEYMDRTAPGFKKQDLDILKCKSELIKRILIIKVAGAQSMEDWCLLFLYYDNQLALPANIEQLIIPDSSKIFAEQFVSTTYLTKPRAADYVVYAPLNATRYPANIPLVGFGNNGRNIGADNLPGISQVETYFDGAPLQQNLQDRFRGNARISRDVYMWPRFSQADDPTFQRQAPNIPR